MCDNAGTRFLISALAFLLTSTVAYAHPPGPKHIKNHPGPEPIKKCGEIDSPGSYVLVDNLFANSPDTCITISARYVTLDLGGFAIIGVGDRVPGFRGVYVEPLQGFEGVAVRNGSVHNFYDGVALEGAAGSVAENLRVVYNLNEGLNLHTGTARSNVLWANGVGVRCIASLVLQNVFSFGNGTNVVEDPGGSCTLVDNAF